jgi:hypothetical protein
MENFQSNQGLAFVFERDRFLAEIADEVKGYPEGYDILKKKQAQETHVLHPVNTDNRAGGSYDHSAGCKKHDRCNEPAYDTCLWPQISCDNQYAAVTSVRPIKSEPT